MTSPRLIALLITGLAACDAPRPPSATPPVLPSVAPATVPPPPPATEDVRLAAPEVDLLHAARVTLAVSSVVENASDTPPKLFDRDLSTAWSARSGELERAWIAVRLPPDARVTALGLTAGYTHRRADLDLFTANVRVRRIRLRWNGELLGEHPLDPDSRTLQRIAVALDGGGELRVEFSETLAGSNPRWRELSVSEFIVWGTVDALTTGRRDPALVVGDLATGTPWPLLAADRGVRRAFTDLRRNILGEGLHPEVDGIYGCSGSGATHCVETVWLDLGDAVAAFARARCGDLPSVVGALTRYDAARASSEREMAAMRVALERESTRPGPSAEQRLLAAEQRATGANERAAERAAEALRACRTENAYFAVADWLPSRDTHRMPRWPTLR